MTIVTGFNNSGYRRYGEKCFPSLQRYWKDEIVVYVEDCSPEIIRSGVTVRTVPGEVTDFLRRHGHDPMMRGEAPYPGKSWKAKDRKSGYSFRFDAVKFHKMAVFAWHAAELQQTGILVWMDGDVKSHVDVPTNFVSRLLDGHDVAYLGRPDYSHSETGFVAFQLPQALPVLRQWARFYIDDSFIAESEWHSAFLFDRARAMNPQVDCHNLSPGGEKHVWFQTELGFFTDHLKGPRKDLEHSPESPRASQQDE